MALRHSSSSPRGLAETPPSSSRRREASDELLLRDGGNGANGDAVAKAPMAAASAAMKRGHLTIFFGAAPGVGKTFAMLQEAGVLQDVERRDVVVGVVETHGRFETTTLLAGFERLAKKTVQLHGGAVVEELDLDAALARKPSLLLVDELAHTNAPGSRHAKRWQDVEELLDAGIEVYTTVNVQHVESVNDVVAQITGVVVRETVPDAVIDAANDIKLIDLPPDELLERLREGKVYLPAQAEKALENFFQKGNLLALRELALRKTAERVDADMQEWRRAHGIEKTWAATDRLLVCLGSSPYAANLLRVGRRMASGLRAQWFAVIVETPSTLRLGRADRTRISHNLRLAEQLGAETVTLTGERPAEEILRFARERNVTKIVVGKPRVFKLGDRFGRSFVDELLLGSGDIDIYATVGEPEKPEKADPDAEDALVKPLDIDEKRRRRDRTGYLAAVVIVVATTLLTMTLFGRTHDADVVMTYLLGIVVIAARFGFRPAIVSGVLSVLAFDFFFATPYLTFTVSDLRHVVTFVVMLSVAIVIATLTQRVRDQAEVARRSERRTALLYAMSRELSRTEGMSAVIRTAARHIEEVFEARTAIFTLRNSMSGGSGGGGGERLADKGTTVRVEYTTEGASSGTDSPSLKDDEQDEGVVRWVLTHKRHAGLGTTTLSNNRGFYVPLVSSGTDGNRRALGVLAIYPSDSKRFEDPEQQRLADAFATQMATSIERARLAEETERARLQVEAEQLRSTLLSSVSHDLRTPLAVMRGAASTLVDDDKKLTEATRKELASAVLEETERLDRQVRNLLDMTRLESGAVHIKKEWQSLQEVIGASFNRIESRFGGRTVTIRAPADLLASFDGVLIDQVMVNLLENAAKYTPEGTPIDVIASRQSRNGDSNNNSSTQGTHGAREEIVVEVSDHGAGITDEERERIFDKFHRGPSERTRGGVGLGLTICRAIITAHGGRIWVENHKDNGANAGGAAGAATGGGGGGNGGASFKFALPIDGEPPPSNRLPEIKADQKTSGPPSS